ncbi:hypothetical protein EDD55_10736 [Varunaivibrio sulfuroxidans]|uniref:Uncharacterized protein n=1 Tax=Varunaivibrio sulfuroxidans TaxID=1773489 RepID=A0A4R3J830_9PROT|nr:hypothetical protein EDD55_10736 [Varunaivibrio sulfuroxidans]
MVAVQKNVTGPPEECDRTWRSRLIKLSIIVA